VQLISAIEPARSFFGDLVECFNFGVGLDLVEGIAVCGVANAVAVDGEGTVSCGCGYVNVRIVVVGVRQIPVSLIKANAVGQDLSNTLAAAVRCAVLCGDFDALLESLKAGKECRTVVVLVLVEASRKSAHIKISLDGNFLENALTR